MARKNDEPVAAVGNRSKVPPALHRMYHEPSADVPADGDAGVVVGFPYPEGRPATPRERFFLEVEWKYLAESSGFLSESAKSLLLVLPVLMGIVVNALARADLFRRGLPYWLIWLIVGEALAFLAAMHQAFQAFRPREIHAVGSPRVMEKALRELGLRRFRHFRRAYRLLFLGLAMLLGVMVAALTQGVR